MRIWMVNSRIFLHRKMAQLVPGDRSMSVKAVAGTFGVLAVRTIYLVEIFILTILKKIPPIS